MNRFLATLTSHLNLIPAIAAAVKTFQEIGHSKETTVQKVVEIVETSAAIGEQVPVPVVQAISGTVETIAQGVFGTPAQAAAPKT